jgi:hypothetical protein
MAFCHMPYCLPAACGNASSPGSAAADARIGELDRQRCHASVVDQAELGCPFTEVLV